MRWTQEIPACHPGSDVKAVVALCCLFKVAPERRFVLIIQWIYALFQLLTQVVMIQNISAPGSILSSKAMDEWCSISTNEGVSVVHNLIDDLKPYVFLTSSDMKSQNRASVKEPT